MEAKTTLARRQDAVQGDFMRKMLTNAGCLLCGILVSRGAVLGSLAPFGASFAAAVPRKYLLSSLLGTAFGYVLLKPSDSFRYLAVVAAIGGLRWLLGDLDKVTKSKVFAPLVHLFRFLQRVFRCFRKHKHADNLCRLRNRGGNCRCGGIFYQHSTAPCRRQQKF
jgi:hypothetical protein